MFIMAKNQRVYAVAVSYSQRDCKIYIRNDKEEVMGLNRSISRNSKERWQVAGIFRPNLGESFYLRDLEERIRVCLKASGKPFCFSFLEQT